MAKEEELRAELAKVTPATVLQAFVEERPGTDAIVDWPRFSPPIGGVNAALETWLPIVRQVSFDPYPASDG